jgi:asparagine synthase (glutamine-hydrolysing)
MCRVAAIVSKNTHNLIDRIETMTKSMAHGGPDDKGHYVNQSLGYALGHRRLSIIDTSPAGHQPMFSLDHRYSISFNGEIYNYVELKKQLIKKGYQFVSSTDTEVLIAAYDAWGVDMLTMLKGMFAFVLVDNIENILIAARDHMGIKPLYIANRAGDTYFTSEVKALTAIDKGWEPNMQWPVWFLTFGFLPEPITTLNNVRLVKKGHYIIYDLVEDTYKERAWYSPLKSNNYTITTEEAVKKTKQFVTSAVERHLMADVKLGVFLSGGIDSSIITMLASEVAKAKKQSPIETFSIEFDDAELSEKPYQQLIAKTANTQHHSLLVTQHDFAAAWEDIHASLDQPTTDAINNYFVCQFAKSKGCKVVLSGLGADEIFGGYPSFNRTAQVDRLKKLTRLQILKTGIAGLVFNYPKRKLDYFKQNIEASEYLTYRGLFTPADTAKILHITEKEVWQILSTYNMPYGYDKIEGAKNKVSAFECDVYMLNQLLKDADVQSMWHSVELRVPFLDIDIIDFMHQVPENIKYPQGGHKYLLVEAFKDMLPEGIINRKKQGFVFPFQKWLSNIAAIQNELFVASYYYKKFTKGKLTHSRLWAIFLTKAYGNLQNFTSLYKAQNPKALFIYLSAFSQTGGIEKVNKLIINSLNDTSSENVLATAYGLHDKHIDDRYTNRYITKGFSSNTLYFLYILFKERKSYDKVIVGHINLAPAVWIMTLLNKPLDIILMTHGIECWGRQYGFKKWLLKRANQIISVSNYTRNQLLENSGIAASKSSVLHNALDPYFTKPDLNSNQAYLRKRYGLKNDTIVLFTLTRMNSTEMYKGYDLVIEALAQMDKKLLHNVKYILAGKYDQSEYKRIWKLIIQNNLEEYIQLPGFIADDEVKDHYQLANLFLMPSSGEGFGIALIEAFASGTNVIAGNTDGSVDALRNGEMGDLINPNDIDKLKYLLESHLMIQKNKLEGYRTKYHNAFEYYDAKEYSKRFKSIALA